MQKTITYILILILFSFSLSFAVELDVKFQLTLNQLYNGWNKIESTIIQLENQGARDAEIFLAVFEDSQVLIEQTGILMVELIKIDDSLLRSFGNDLLSVYMKFESLNPENFRAMMGLLLEIEEKFEKIAPFIGCGPNFS